jgi:hypothetical protein
MPHGRKQIFLWYFQIAGTIVPDARYFVPYFMPEAKGLRYILVVRIREGSGLSSEG